MCVGFYGYEIKIMSTELPVCYCDGGAKNNGKPDAKAGAGVYFGPDHQLNMSAPVPGLQTNNRAEVWALILALRATQGPIEIRSDSKWAICCTTKVWKATKNLDLMQIIWELCANRSVTFTHIKGHSGEPGNEAADALATQGIDGQYSGPYETLQ